MQHRGYTPDAQVGDTVPDFTLPTDSGTTLSSKDMIKDAFVLFSYPKAGFVHAARICAGSRMSRDTTNLSGVQANTSGCTTQACGFRDSAAPLAAKGYKIYGISADKPADQASWKQQYKQCKQLSG